jgi:hypothetical protein
MHDFGFLSQALRLDLSSVLKDQSLLYPFMQFLKGEGCVNILQFCLDVGKTFFAFDVLNLRPCHARRL